MAEKGISVLDTIAVRAGSDAHESLEMPIEVALIGESGIQGNVCDWPAFSEELLRAADPDLREVCMRRKAHVFAEHAKEVETAQTCNVAQPVQGRILEVVRLQVVNGPPNGRVAGIFQSNGELVFGMT